MSDSTEFLVKTNNDVDAWIEEFYVDGKNSPFRLHCQWAWQEQERRHRAVEAELVEALKDLLYYAESGWDHFPDCAINARNVIAKATIIQ